MSKRKIVVWLFAGILGMFLFWCFAGFTITPLPQSPSEELEQARRLWKSQNISSYQMTVFFWKNFGPTGRFKFTIASNKVVEIENPDRFLKNLPVDTFQPDWYIADNGYSAYFPKSLAFYTIDQLFDFAEDKIRNEVAPPVIAWCSKSWDDPSRLYYVVKYDPYIGYIAGINYTDCPKRPTWGIGLLCPVGLDCANGFTISDLTPLP